MRLKSNVKAVFISLFFVTSALAQVQLFEQGNSGLSFRGGGQYHPKIMTGTVGAEYNIEGKFTVGGLYGQVSNDTLFELSSNPFRVNSRIFEGYGILEIIEPDKLFPLSLSLIADYTYAIGQAKDGAGIIQNSNKQSIIGGGPQVGSRFFVGENGTFIPYIQYKLSYVKISRLRTPKDTELWHDVGLTLAYSHMFNDTFGALFDPQVNVRIGDTDSPEFYANINLGFVIRLPSY